MEIERPFAGPFLRQNWGRCVFYDDGCKLHATFGPESKPKVCRQFPTHLALEDPACYHLQPLEPPAPDRPRLDDLSLGRAVADWLDELPLAMLVDGPLLGPQTTATLERLVGAHPAEIPSPHRTYVLDTLARVDAARTSNVHDAEGALIGGAQLFAATHQLTEFAAWIRFLELGLDGLDLALETR